MAHLRIVRSFWLIVALASLVLSAAVPATHAAAMPEIAASGVMPDCEGASLAPGCDTVCPPSALCSSDYGPAGVLIGSAACDPMVSAATALLGDERDPGTPDQERILPPPRS